MNEPRTAPGKALVKVAPEMVELVLAIEEEAARRASDAQVAALEAIAQWPEGWPEPIPEAVRRIAAGALSANPPSRFSEVIEAARTVLDDFDLWDMAGARELADLVGATPAPQSAPLDVERLTAAVFEADRPGDWPTWDDYLAAFGSAGIPPWRRKAEKIAAEYARLAGPRSPSQAEPETGE